LNLRRVKKSATKSATPRIEFLAAPKPPKPAVSVKPSSAPIEIVGPRRILAAIAIRDAAKASHGKSIIERGRIMLKAGLVTEEELQKYSDAEALKRRS
jgi:hypothetical protein